MLHNPRHPFFVDGNFTFPLSRLLIAMTTLMIIKENNGKSGNDFDGNADNAGNSKKAKLV